MSERTEYAVGEFTWVDLTTPDTEAALSFYGELLGWEGELAGPVEVAGGYGFFMSDGKMVAGYGPVMSEGQPPAWTGYVKVASADETAEKAKQAGGQVLAGPMDLPNDAGRMAVAMDSAGAVFAFIQQGGRAVGAQIVNEPGSWTWNQLATPDLEQAAKFYGDVFGWRLEASEGAPTGYSMWHVEGQRWPEGMAGAMPLGAQMPEGTPPHWMVFLGIENADAAAETVKANGGRVLLEPLDIPAGRFLIASDPFGAPFGAIQPNYPEPR